MIEFFSELIGRVRSVPNKILVIKLDHIGDFVIAAPAISRTQALFPNSDITLLCQPAIAELAQYMFPKFEILTRKVFADRVSAGNAMAIGDQDARAFWRNVNRKYDLAIHYRFEPDTLAYLKHSPAKVKVGFSRGEEFLRHGLDAKGARSRIPSMQDRLTELALEVGKVYDCADHYSVEVPRLLALRSTVEDYFIVAPGAGNDLKIWPIERFAQVASALCEKLNLNVVLVGDYADVELGLEFERLSSNSKTRNFIGQTTLLELTKIIGSARFLIGNDSSPVHISASMGVPTVSVHGGQDLPEIWAPKGPNVITLSSKTECAPCNLRHLVDCKFAVRCLTDIEAGDVLEAVSLLLGVDILQN